MDKVRQAFQLLLLTYSLGPIAAGADKFLHILRDDSWVAYLAPVFPQMLGITKEMFMMGVGAIEIAAGLLAFIKPSIGAYVVGLWLLGIVVNLLLLGSYYDIALRDLALAMSAFALGRLANYFATKEEK
jgi:hypothetical protein